MASYFTDSSLGFAATNPQVRRARPLSNRMAKGLRTSSGKRQRRTLS